MLTPLRMSKLCHRLLLLHHIKEAKATQQLRRLDQILSIRLRAEAPVSNQEMAHGRLLARSEQAILLEERLHLAGSILRNSLGVIRPSSHGRFHSHEADIAGEH